MHLSSKCQESCLIFKHENKYIDGINPYIFKSKNDRKILHLDLFGYDKIKYLIKLEYARITMGN